MNLLDFIADTEERKEIVLELQKIKYYKNLLLINKANELEIMSFINQVVNKYRSKIEVKDFYTNSKDEYSSSQYDTLCVIEKMINQYVQVKVLEEINKNKAS